MGATKGQEQTPLKVQFAAAGVTDAGAYFPKKLREAVIKSVTDYANNNGEGISFEELSSELFGGMSNASTKGYLAMCVALVPEIESQRGPGGGILPAGFEVKGRARVPSTIRPEQSVIDTVLGVANRMANVKGHKVTVNSLKNVLVYQHEELAELTASQIQAAIAYGGGFDFHKGGELRLNAKVTPRTEDEVKALVESMKESSAG